MSFAAITLCVASLNSSDACTVYYRLNIEIAGSNPARGMDVCLRVSVLCVVLCFGRGLVLD
jgi:hypothetical protein